MLEKTKLNFYRFLSAILLVVMLSMSGVMYVSAHGGDITLIHACVNNRTGAVRVVSATTTCDANKETALDWGIQGPKGPAGPQGPQGPAGLGITRENLYEVGAQVTVPAGYSYGTTANCLDDNDVVLSGGHFSYGWWFTIVASEPILIGPQQGWHITADNGKLDPAVLSVYAVCLRVD